MMLQQHVLHLVSWTLGLLDQLFRVMNFLLGPARPKFFSKGYGDLESYYQRRTALLRDIQKGIVHNKLLHGDITWTTTVQDQGAIVIQEGRFRSPLADVLPKESHDAQFLLVQPNRKNRKQQQSSNNSNNNDIFVLMLPATGEMGRGTRLALARTLAAQHGWCSVILTAAYYGRRKPAAQTLFFIDSVRDLLLQSQAIIEESAMLMSYFQNEHGRDDNKHTRKANNLVCVTGFSYGAAMASCASALAVRTGADGTRLACAPYVGSASPNVLADGVLESSMDWKALQKSNTTTAFGDSSSHRSTQQRLYQELNATQLTTLSGTDSIRNDDDGDGSTTTTTKRQPDSPIAVVKAVSMRNDLFITPRYARQLHSQLATLTAPSNPPTVEWLWWGGHVMGALLRPIYHKKLVVDAVLELQKVQ